MVIIIRLVRGDKEEETSAKSEGAVPFGGGCLCGTLHRCGLGWKEETKENGAVVKQKQTLETIETVFRHQNHKVRPLQ